MTPQALASVLTRAHADEPRWLAGVRIALAHAPEPEAARALACDVLEGLPADELAGLCAKQQAQLGPVLLGLCGIAPFFAAYLRRRPEWLLALLREDFSQPRARDAFSAAAAAVPADDTGDALRRFKYFQLARISVRDSDPELVPLARSGETLLELSWLADALLGRALEHARARVARRFGPPRWRNEAGADEELGFAVLGLGKLGAEELNFSSDVDLLYVFESPALRLDAAHAGVGAAYASLLPVEYFTHVAQNFGKLVSETRAEGFLYRVDLDLRPEGAQGTLVVSDEALVAHYESWADTWEKATFTKARPVAGDLGFGWRAIRAVEPTIYRTATDYSAVNAIRQLKDEIASHRAGHGRREDGFDVELDAGGIRDVEFVAQALQLLHGGRIEQIRARSTQDALERLRDVRLLSPADAAELLDAYRFLRRLENRLQMVGERQTHALSSKPDDRARAARAMGFFGEDGPAHFEHALQQHRNRVRALFQGLFFDGRSDHVFELFARTAPQLLANPAARAMLECLADDFAREIAAASNPERALNNLDRFVRGVGPRRFYFELLLDRPELVPRLTALFSSSNYLSQILATHPILIEPAFYDPNVLLLDRVRLEADFDVILRECRPCAQAEPSGRDAPDEDEAPLAALRRFYHRQLVNVALLDLGGEVTRRELESALSDVAEVCIGRALAFSRRWVALRRPELARAAERTRFIAVGMGKLASRELAYGSDLDLVFVFDADGDETEQFEAQEYATRLGQRLISLLSTSTGEGLCYEVDARLRPSGNQGTLVSSLAAFERYHAGGAPLRARMAALRARSVAGDATLAARFDTLRAEHLRDRLPQGARAELLHVRARMERELAKEGARRRDFKRGRGGLLDVESVTQFLQLRHACAHPELLEAERIDVQLQRLCALGLLPPEQATPLLEGWDFLQRLSARLRVVENRSISDLDEERGDLEGLAKTLGYASGEREGDARRALLTDYHRHTEAIRAAFERALTAGA